MLRSSSDLSHHADGSPDADEIGKTQRRIRAARQPSQLELSCSTEPALVPTQRTLRSGPELDLVNRFLKDLPLRLSQGATRTVFVEPKLESNYPDMVAVDWDEAAAECWPASRLDLTADDLRVLHTLHSIGPASEESLATLLARPVDASLRRAELAGIVVFQRGNWKIEALRRSFAVERITAFEAKMGDWRGALKQASLNLWFATESYVLLPKAPHSEEAWETAKKMGIGIWVLGYKQPYLAASRTRSNQPVSYASWLFNEWAWHRSLRGGS